MWMKKTLIPKEELIDLYCNQQKSAREIASIYNCVHNTIVNRLKELGIEIRSAYDKKYYENRYPNAIGHIDDNAI